MTFIVENKEFESHSTVTLLGKFHTITLFCFCPNKLHLKSTNIGTIRIPNIQIPEKSENWTFLFSNGKKEKASETFEYY